MNCVEMTHSKLAFSSYVCSYEFFIMLIVKITNKIVSRFCADKFKIEIFFLLQRISSVPILCSITRIQSAQPSARVVPKNSVHVFS